MCLTALVNVFRLVRWVWTLAGVWFACIVGIALSFYGFVMTKWRTPRVPPRTSTGLEGVALPTLSVVVPTHNEAGTISKTLLHLIDNTKVSCAPAASATDVRHMTLAWPSLRAVLPALVPCARTW